MNFKLYETYDSHFSDVRLVVVLRRGMVVLRRADVPLGTSGNTWPHF